MAWWRVSGSSCSSYFVAEISLFSVCCRCCCLPFASSGKKNERLVFAALGSFLYVRRERYAMANYYYPQNKMWNDASRPEIQAGNATALREYSGRYPF